MANAPLQNKLIATAKLVSEAPPTVKPNTDFEISGKLYDEDVNNKEVSLKRSCDGVLFKRIKGVQNARTNAKGEYAFSVRQNEAGTHLYKATIDDVDSASYTTNTVGVTTLVSWPRRDIGAIICCLAVLGGLPILLALLGVAGIHVTSLLEMYIIWLIVFAATTTLLIAAGHGTKGRLSGLLIDERNRMSASRLQIIMWTLVILPAILALICINVGYGSPSGSALSIAVPVELWALLGISGGAAVAAPVANDATNRSKDLAEGAAARAGTSVDALDHEGVLDVNLLVKDAKFADMFKGDEVGNRDNIDISKVQMLILSFGLAAGYGSAIVLFILQAMQANPVHIPLLNGLPAVDSSLASLLLISQGTYVGYKAAAHTQGADETAKNSDGKSKS
ncbi:MAG: hypothetical protein WCE82_06250 [Halobacteriota archaeon]